jgi:hypothetical protein
LFRNNKFWETNKSRDCKVPIYILLSRIFLYLLLFLRINIYMSCTSDLYPKIRNYTLLKNRFCKKNKIKFSPRPPCCCQFMFIYVNKLNKMVFQLNCFIWISDVFRAQGIYLNQENNIYQLHKFRTAYAPNASSPFSSSARVAKKSLWPRGSSVQTPICWRIWARRDRDLKRKILGFKSCAKGVYFWTEEVTWN